MCCIMFCFVTISDDDMTNELIIWSKFVSRVNNEINFVDCVLLMLDEREIDASCSILLGLFARSAKFARSPKPNSPAIVRVSLLFLLSVPAVCTFRATEQRELNASAASQRRRRRRVAHTGAQNLVQFTATARVRPLSLHAFTPSANKFTDSLLIVGFDAPSHRAQVRL